MGAITGIFNRNGNSVSLELIKKMNNCLSHRGQDGSGLWCNGYPVALGHQMLHTTVESLHEELPFEYEDLVITSDARIDNRSELAPILGIQDVKNVPDSLFIIKAYKKWNEKCVDKLLGDFAFAIFDKEKNELFCARDHLGVKPFYYYLSDEIFIFSTEIKAILSYSNLFKKKLNKLKAAIHLMNLDDQDLTFYKGIFPLKPSHFIKVTQIKNNSKKYWQLDPELRICFDTDEEYFNTFQNIFSEAVKCRLRCAYPVGFELSGGLDSSSVVCMAQKINNSTINTFSSVFNDISQSDERRYIEKIIEKGVINPHYIYGDDINPLEDIKTILWHVEQPFYTPNIVLIRERYKLMNKKGIRIFLTGHGGDQTISYGKNYFKELFLNFQFKKLISEIKYNSIVINENIIKLFLHKVFLPISFGIIPDYCKNQYHKSSFSKKNFLNKYFSKNIELNKYLECNHWKPIREANNYRKHHYYIINYPHQSMLEWIDLLSASHSIEPRHPFFDKRLIEFCYAIPSDLKFRYGWNRYIQRKAMNKILPKDIQWRSNKTGYDAVHRRNLILFNENFLDKNILRKNDLLKPYVDLKYLQLTYEKLKSGVDVKDSIYIWLVLIFYLWLQNEEFS